jgi:hypothetical protein
MRRKRLNVRPPTGAITPPHRSFTSSLYRRVNGRYQRADDRRVIAAALAALAENVASGPQLATKEPRKNNITFSVAVSAHTV